MTYRIKAKFVDITNGQIVPGVHYADGQPALTMYHDESYGRPERLSINLIEHGLRAPEGHVFVRDDAEHEGLPDALVEAGVAEKVREVEFGPFNSRAWLMRVLSW